MEFCDKVWGGFLRPAGENYPTGALKLKNGVILYESEEHMSSDNVKKN